mgnify:CR=1 FL=1|jgi:hypothetical protein
MDDYVEVNDLSPTKNEDVDRFLNDSVFYRADKKKEYVTDSDYNELFTELVAQEKPDSFNSFQERVGNMFEHKLDDRLDRWANKMSLDKTRLQNIFSGPKE